MVEWVKDDDDDELRGESELSSRYLIFPEGKPYRRAVALSTRERMRGSMRECSKL